MQSIDRCFGVCTNGVIEVRIDLCTCRYILSALLHLHQAGFAHTDLRWENIILQPAGTWVLIDLEFAYTIPFTPDGKLVYVVCLLCAVH